MVGCLRFVRGCHLAYMGWLYSLRLLNGSFISYSLRSFLCLLGCIGDLVRSCNVVSVCVLGNWRCFIHRTWCNWSWERQSLRWTSIRRYLTRCPDSVLMGQHRLLGLVGFLDTWAYMLLRSSRSCLLVRRLLRSASLICVTLLLSLLGRCRSWGNWSLGQIIARFGLFQTTISQSCLLSLFSTLPLWLTHSDTCRNSWGRFFFINLLQRLFESMRIPNRSGWSQFALASWEIILSLIRCCGSRSMWLWSLLVWATLWLCLILLLICKFKAGHFLRWFISKGGVLVHNLQTASF